MLNQVIQLTTRARVNMQRVVNIILLCCSVTSVVHALPFNQISQLYFFGDSLTDSGFNDLFPLIDPAQFAPGKAPTFTTYGGYTWSQYVARDIKGYVLPQGYPIPNPPDTLTNNTTPLIAGNFPVSGTLQGVNYACGGSTTNSTGFDIYWAPSLHSQVNRFLDTAPRPLDPNAVYFIWSGANDLLTVLAQPAPTQLQLLMAANTAVNNIASEVALLSAHGAKRIVVLSLPNIGYTPFIGQAAVNNPSLPGSIKTVTFSFNSMLNQQLGKVVAAYGTKILYVDVYTALDNVIIATKAGKPYVVAGQSFQFVNYTTPACSTVSSALFCPPDTPPGYLFADGVHPSDMAHRLLSLVVETQMQSWA